MYQLDTLLHHWLQLCYQLHKFDLRGKAVDILNQIDSKIQLDMLHMNLYQLLRLMGCNILLHIVLVRHYQKGSNDLKDKHIVELIPKDSNNQHCKWHSFLSLGFLCLLRVDKCQEGTRFHADQIRPTSNTYQEDK